MSEESEAIEKFPQWVVLYEGVSGYAASTWCIQRLSKTESLYYGPGGAAEDYEWDRIDQARVDDGLYVQTTEAEAMSRVIEPADVVTVVFHKYVVWQNGGLKNLVIKENGWELNQVDWHNVRDLGVFETVEVQE